MSLLSRLLPSHFGDASQRSVKDAIYTVTNSDKFNRAVFTGGKIEDGEKLKCEGRNGGGWPQFSRVNGEAGAKPISMTYRAKGTPESFGLIHEKA